MIEILKGGIVEVVKILFLLFAITSIFGFLKTYLSQQRIKGMLIIKTGLKGHFTASLLGTTTTFSSDSSIKLFNNFLDSGVPLGIALSFLITSPIVNEYIAIMMLIFFGFKITLIYIVSGILIGTFGGFILSKFNLEKDIHAYFKRKIIGLERDHSTKKRIKIGLNQGLFMLKKIGIFIFFGVILRIIIQSYVTQDTISKIVFKLGAWGVPLATLIGSPFPGFGAAVIPVAVAMFEKGIPLGTAIAFLLAFTALSLPKAFELKKIMKLRLVLLFFFIIILSVITIGYLVNFLI